MRNYLRCEQNCERWHPLIVCMHPRCALLCCGSSQHVAYNQVDPNLRYSYTRPAHIDEKAWKKVRSGYSIGVVA